MKYSFLKRKRSLLFPLIILFCSFCSSLHAQISEFEVGQVICIESNGYFLADDGNSTAPVAIEDSSDMRALWLVHYVQNIGEKAKPLINLSTGRILKGVAVTETVGIRGKELSDVTWSLGTEINNIGETEWVNENSVWHNGFVTEKANFWSDGSTVYYRPMYNGTKWTIEKVEIANTQSYTTKAYKKGTIDINSILHSKGQANSALLNNGYQQVHENENIIYANNGEVKELKVQISNVGNPHYPRGFYRWYNYADGSDVGNNLNVDENYYQSNKGVFRIYNIPEGQLTPVTYKMGDSSVKIACDISQYIDVKGVKTASGYALQEPTLSYRMIYDIRPASEMAAMLDKCGNTPLEEYNILAPAGSTTVRIGPKYRWQGTNNNYYYSEKTPTAITGKWYSGDTELTELTVIDDRLITIASPTVGDTAVYYLKSGNYIIAKFNVTSQDVSKVGPLKGEIKSHSSLLETYELAASQLFDFTDEAGNIYTKSLLWDETTYGFAYTTGAAGMAKTRTQGFADWSEYILLKNSNGLATSYLSQNIKDFSANGEGYFLYIDANEVPGKVADLTIDGNLCPGSKILVSARVVNAQAQISDLETNPNLNFIVTGISGGEETQILVFTTGDIGVTDGAWNQVLFEVSLDNKTYEEYRLRIDNNGTSADGNDFAIDDIRIYTSRPQIMGIQAMVGCPKDRFDKSNVAILRIDYHKAMSKEKQDLYYSWMNEGATGQDRLALNYKGTAGTDFANYFGKISLQQTWKKTSTEVKDRYYDSLDAFLNSEVYAEMENKDEYEFFVTERGKDEDGKDYEYLVLYIVHKDELFVANKTYKAQMIFDASSITSFDQLDKCASQYVFRVVPRANIVLDGKERDAAVLQNLSMGSYPLAVKTYGTATNGTTIQSMICYSDWLIVDENMSEAERWGYANRLVEFREEVQASGKDQIAVLSGGSYKGLYELYQQGNVVLNSKEVKADISERGKPRTFMAVPIPDESSGFTICPIPLEIILRAEVSAVLANPTDKESYAEMPPSVQGSSCIIRIPEGFSGDFPEMDIDFLNQELFKNLTSSELTTLGEMVLCTTDDLDYQNKLHSTVYFELKAGKKLNQLVENDIVTINRTSATLTMKPGKHYGFHSKLTTVGGAAITPAFNFDIYVVPNTVVWNPTLPNSAWHNDDNWKTTNGATAFIPLSVTNVIIKASDKALPVVPINKDVLGSGANKLLKYDVVPSGMSTFSSCNNIYFESGAELARQNKLSYKKAYVDVDLDKEGADKWEMLSMPLEDVVRGDLYIPKSGDGVFNFAETAVIDNRKHNSFRLKAYASSFENTKIEDGEVSTVKVSSSTWTDPANKFNMVLDKCRGYAVSRECATEQNFVRLPKTEDTYYMYYVSGTGVESPIKTPWATYGDISRTNSHKLVYDKSSDSTLTVTFVNAEASNYFLIGNPFLVNLDVAQFFELNKSAGLNSLFWYEYTDGTILPVQPGKKVLRPKRAMFVQTSKSMKELTVKFTPSMMSYNESFEVEVVPTRSKQVLKSSVIASEKKLTLIANVEGKISRTFIEETNYSSKDYFDTEDAELLMLDAELTPIGLYSVTNNYALLYNATPDILDIPISVLVLDTTINAETFALTFEGIDSFDETLYLYDEEYDSKLPLIEGLTLELEMPKGGKIRYYITRENRGGITTEEEFVTDANVCAISSAGVVNIYSNVNMKEIKVYDVAGREIYSAVGLEVMSHEVDLPAGVYMLQVAFDEKLHTQKFIVK